MVLNEKYFPKRARFVISNKLVDLATDVSINYDAANDIFPNTEEKLETRERKKLKKFKKKLDKGIIAFSDIRNLYESWKGSLKGKKCYRTLQNMNELFNRLFIDEWRLAHE